MSKPTDDERPSFAAPEQEPADDQRPPPHESPYGQPPGAPLPAYGRPPGTPPAQHPPQHPPQWAPPHGQAPYDAQWGYGPPGVPAQPRTQPVGDDATWALFCYVGTIIGGFLAPLVIYFIKRNESAFIRHHAAQALNYSLTILLQIMISLAVGVTVIIATHSRAGLAIFIPVFVFHLVAQYVFLILGTIRSSRGEMYRLPTWTCWRMIR